MVKLWSITMVCPMKFEAAVNEIYGGLMVDARMSSLKVEAGHSQRRDDVYGNHGSYYHNHDVRRNTVA
jgi:hypothetical protein